MPTTPAELAGRLVTYIINPILAILFAAALAVFLWGIVGFLTHLSSGGDTSKGKWHMLWGIVGLFIMTVAWGILQVATATFGISIPH